jgi:hypothetical protein
MEELVLYADDGILIGGEDKFKEFVRKAIKVGAEIAIPWCVYKHKGRKGRLRKWMD